jgi:hypothetical protein
MAMGVEVKLLHLVTSRFGGRTFYKLGPDTLIPKGMVNIN